MQLRRKNSHYLLHQYGLTLLILAAAVALRFFSGIVCAVGALFMAAVYFVSSRYWLREIERTDRQRCLLDEQLIQSQKLASIGELSAGIAHEINNPIAIIGQEVEWMRDLLAEGPEKTGEELTDCLREIRQQVDRCKEITQKLLNFARKVDPVIQEVDVNRLIEDMAKLVEKEASLKNIKIVRCYSKDLPRLYVDPPLLRQVILNLLNNATYAVRSDGSITIATQLFGDDQVSIQVSDTGCGIPREELSKIFDPFFTTKPPGKGTGLGLSICHGIIERLGGRISVWSEVGKGTIFTVLLPLNKP